MLRYFLESRKPHRVWNLPAQRLADAAGCSLILAQEVQWGLYNPLPERFLHVIDMEEYDKYRLETRQEFGEAFDFPRFKTFIAFADGFQASIQEVAKALCLQRSLMQAHDRARLSGQSFYRAEINTAFLMSAGPEYVFDPRNGLVSSCEVA